MSRMNCILGRRSVYALQCDDKRGAEFSQPDVHWTECAGTSFMAFMPPVLIRFLLVALLALPVFADDAAASAHPPYEKREDHDPNGIGVFYMDREIAHVMGHQAANWLERPEREEEERTDLLIDALKFREGEVVADIGCGSGFISRKIAKKINPTGIVYGVDIQPEMLALLARRMAMFRITNVKGVQGTTTDPKLPPASCDTMIMVDVYHEFDQPYEMMRGMIAGLKQGGRIVFVEFRKEDPTLPIKRVHEMSVDQVKKEMSVQPELEFAETIETLPRQHIIIFKKK
jgi:ubiquinone/menaquinone biosynthesis C-methylase UbiE